MNRTTIRLGTITNIYNQYGIVRAQVVALDEEAPEDVILLQPYGQNACPPIGSMVEIFVNFGNPENTYAIPYNPSETPQLKVGESIIYNHFGSKVYLKENGDIDILPANGANVNVTATKISTSGDIDVAGVYKVDGTRVVTNQQPTIANPAGGSTIDTQARAAIISILTALKTHGLIAT